jgi:hypothetical protein
MSQLQQLLTRCACFIGQLVLNLKNGLLHCVTTTIELDPEEPIPLDEDGFCSYLDQLDPLWQLLDLTDEQ